MRQHPNALPNLSYACTRSVSLFRRTAPLLLWPGLLVAAEPEAGPEPYRDSIPVQALAAEPETAETVRLERVVVRGEKLGRGLSETSTSTSITSGAELERYGDASVFDLMRRVGNVSVTDNGTFSIRGINSTGVDANEFGRPLASIYVDGVAQDRVSLQSGALDAWDVEQVEILRGPQSTSQGRNSLAGSVVLATRDPTLYWDARGRVLGGENGLSRYSLAGGGPLGAGFAFRIAGDESRDDGYVNNIVRDEPEWASSRTRNGRVKIAYQPDFLPDLRAVFSGTYAEENEGGVDLNFEDADTPPSRTAQAGDRTFYRFRSRSLALNLDYALAPGLDLTAVTGRLLGDGDFQLDGDRTEADLGLASGSNATQNFTQELRLNFTHGPLRGLVGLYYGRFQDANDARNDGLPVTLERLVPGGSTVPVIVETDVATTLSERERNQALFAEVDWQPLDRLTLTAGLRYDRVERQSSAPFTTERADLIACTPEALAALGPETCLPGIDVLPILSLPLLISDALPILSLPTLIPRAGDEVAPTDFDILLPKLGARYALTERLDVFASYAEGYRAGGAEILFTTGQLNTFDPEFTRNVEIGLRSDFFGGDVGLRSNLFYVDWRDQQVMVLTESRDDSFTANAAKSRLYGAEIEADWRGPQGFSAYASLGYTRTRFEDFVEGRTVTTGDPTAITPGTALNLLLPPPPPRDFSGNEFARAPRWAASVGGARDTLGDGWLAALSVSVTDDAFDDPDNDPRSGADRRTLIDARVGYRLGAFTLSLAGRNLLDETYAVRRTFLDPDPAFSRDRAGRLVTYGDPRRFSLQLEARW